MGQVQQGRQKSPISGWIPAIGFIMAVCFAAIGWALSEPLLDYTIDTFRGFDGNELDDVHPDAMQFAFAAFIWLVLLCVGSFIVAAAAPRKKSQVKEKDLKSEKEELLKEQKRRKKRQIQMQKEAARQRKASRERKSGE
ncbi:MAG: hypothetical protein AAF787_01250 [Chloroflexota bacterium]